MSLLDYTTGSTNNTTNQIGNTTQTQASTAGRTDANVYSGQQTGIQGLAGNFIATMLQNNGQAPVDPNPANAAYANYLFNKNVAPKIAAANGPNSPALWGAQQELNLALAAQASQQAQQGALSALQAAQQYGFTPQGTVSNQASSQAGNGIQVLNSNVDQRTKQTTIDGGGLLDAGQSTLQGLAGMAGYYI